MLPHWAEQGDHDIIVTPTQSIRRPSHKNPTAHETDRIRNFMNKASWWKLVDHKKITLCKSTHMKLSKLLYANNTYTFFFYIRGKKVSSKLIFSLKESKIFVSIILNLLEN